jgi:hypothetical protein
MIVSHARQLNAFRGSMTHVSHVTIPGLDAPQDARSACDALRPRYASASILVLAARGPSMLQNVRTIVVYGTDRLLPGADRSTLIRAQGDRPEYLLLRASVSAAEADAFVAYAQTGSVTVPGTSVDVAYRLESWWEGLLPRATLDGTHSSGPSGTLSVWRRRRQPTIPGLLGEPLTTATLFALLAKTPQDLDADFALLEMRDDVTSFEALDQYFLVPARAGSKHRGSHISVTVIDPEAWLPTFGSATIRIDGRRFGLRQSARTRQITGAGTYEIPVSESAAETALEADGILLDVSGGYFIGVPPSVPPISGGPMPDLVGLEQVKAAWLARNDAYFDLVVDPRARSADPAADGRDKMRRLVSRHGASGPITIDVVDPYAFDSAMLTVVASALPRGSTIRIVCAVSDMDALFPGILQSTSVHVERYAASTIPQHDRFLRMQGAVWSIGISLNQLGRCFSAILEVRDSRTVVALSDIIDACVVGRPVAHS